MSSDSNWCSKKDDANLSGTTADSARTQEHKSEQSEEDHTPTTLPMNRGPNHRNISNKLKGTLALNNCLSYRKSNKSKDYRRGRMDNMELDRKTEMFSDFLTMTQQPENWGRSSDSITDAKNKNLEKFNNQNILVGLAKKTISFVRSTIDMIVGNSDGDTIIDDVTGRPRNIGDPGPSIAIAETNTHNNHNKYELLHSPHADLTTSEDVCLGDTFPEISTIESSREIEQTESILGVNWSTSNRRDVAIGIDLGTCYASAAACQGNHVDVIQNNDGKRKIPCCVSFTNIGRLIGVAAEDQAENYIKSTIFNVKRLIGRVFYPHSLQDYQNKWAPLNITMSYNRPAFEVEYKGEMKQFLPEEISSMILVEMKEIAEAYLKSDVKDVVITVPANFTDSQRIATRDAGRIAGLNVLEIINDTTAAAITYHSLQVWTEHFTEKNVLIVDLGGGTFDVSVIKVTIDSIEVKSVVGNTQFGGGDFDANLVRIFVKCNESNLRGILDDQKSLAKLRKAFEKAKKILYNLEEAHINIPSFIDGCDYTLKVTRAMFEELNANLLKFCTETVEACVSNAMIEPDDIDDIVLVGGSSRIPHLQRHLQKYFKKEHFKRINPDEAVVQGAAIRAAFLCTKENWEPREFSLIPPKIHNIRPYFNVFSYNFYQRVNVQISRIPLITNNPHEMIIATTMDNQYFIPIYVYGGDCPDFYAQFFILGIPPRPAAMEISITFIINNDGILNLTAQEKNGKHSNLLVKKEYFDCLNDELIEEKKKEANMLRAEAEDKYKEKRDAAIESFELCIYNMKRKVKNTPLYCAVEDQGKNAYKWIESNPHATEEQIMNKMEEFRCNCNYLPNRH
ncbi:hypothetical protein LUZ60_002274 [Juncus effusus]|nr:hypothetical protein LUZ60_002274 [Juncus effusus]